MAAGATSVVKALQVKNPDPMGCNEQPFFLCAEVCKVTISVPAGDPPEEALRLAQQLVIATPEFHAPTTAGFAASPRPPATGVQPRGRPYKAIIVLFLHGGIDVRQP